MATLSGFFGLLAVLLAVIGLYGVISYIVAATRLVSAWPLERAEEMLSASSSGKLCCCSFLASALALSLLSLPLEARVRCSLICNQTIHSALPWQPSC